VKLIRGGLTLLLLAFVAANCGGNNHDDGGKGTGTQTTEQPTTTVPTATTEAAASPTTTILPTGAGALVPPEGLTQAQADAYAASVVSANRDAGWPATDIDAVVPAMQAFLELGDFACGEFDKMAELDRQEGSGRALGTTVMVGAVADGLDNMRTVTIDALHKAGVQPALATKFADDFVKANVAAMGDHVCVRHAQLFSQVLDRL